MHYRKNLSHAADPRTHSKALSVARAVLERSAVCKSPHFLHRFFSAVFFFSPRAFFYPSFFFFAGLFFFRRLFFCVFFLWSASFPLAFFSARFDASVHFGVLRSSVHNRVPFPRVGARVMMHAAQHGSSFVCLSVVGTLAHPFFVAASAATAHGTCGQALQLMVWDTVVSVYPWANGH